MVKDLPFRNRIGDHKVITVTKEARQHTHTYQLGKQEQRVEHSHLVEIATPSHIHGEGDDDSAA